MNLLLDLGTANFRAAVAGSNEIMSESCVVARNRTGRVIIGSEAAQMVGRNPEDIRIFNPIERGAIKDLDAVVEVVKFAAKAFNSSSFGRRFALTLSLPSGLTQVERKAMEEAGKLAGAHQVDFVDASVAAALGAGLPIESPYGCLVVNLGAGVTEAAVLSMQAVVDSHQSTTGGLAIDQSIVEYIRKQYSFLLGMRSAEHLKRQCGEEKQSDCIEVRGKSLKTGLPDNLLVPRSIVDEQLASYCEMIVDLIVQTISTCPPELVGDIVDRGIVLVGGGAQVTGLFESLVNRTEVPIIMAEEPENCVIRGLIKARLRMGSGRARSWSGRPSVPSFNGKKAVVGLYKSMFGNKASK